MRFKFKAIFLFFIFSFSANAYGQGVKLKSFLKFFRSIFCCCYKKKKDNNKKNIVVSNIEIKITGSSRDSLNWLDNSYKREEELEAHLDKNLGEEEFERVLNLSKFLYDARYLSPDSGGNFGLKRIPEGMFVKKNYKKNYEENTDPNCIFKEEIENIGFEENY